MSHCEAHHEPTSATQGMAIFHVQEPTDILRAICTFMSIFGNVRVLTAWKVNHILPEMKTK